MSSRRTGVGFVRRALASALTLLTTLTVHASGGDVDGGRDHPLVKRFAGSRLVGYRQVDWDQTFVPIGMGVKNHIWQDKVSLEGRITRLFYVAPKGKSKLEVWRNYEQALQAMGFKRKFLCEADCSELYFGLNHTIKYAEAVHWPQLGGIAGVNRGTYNYRDAVQHDGRLLYGTLGKAGQEAHVLLYVSSAGYDGNDIAGAFLQIVEPKPMQGGQVTVDSPTLQETLATEGRVALYGIYFDTGKAEVKHESQPQLVEMAKLLHSQPALKVYVVGHTDNAGSLDANTTLSLQRAQSVIHVLHKEHRVDARRLVARGVASLAPVASNQDEQGRGRNRRVELVVQ